jgi:hypothetical protein
LEFRPLRADAVVMNATRSPEPALPDAPLRDDVRRLGALVGRMLAEQVAPAFLDEVERVRVAAIARRQEGAPLAGLADSTWRTRRRWRAPSPPISTR